MTITDNGFNDDDDDDDDDDDGNNNNDMTQCKIAWDLLPMQI